MPDIYNYNPNYTRSGRLGTYLNQYGATSGRVPSARVLDDIIQGELDAAYNNMYRNKQLQLQQQQFTEGQRQFDVGQQNAMETAAGARRTDIVTSAIQGLGTYGLYQALKPAAVPGATGLTTGAAPGSQAAYMGLNAAPTVAGQTTLGTQVAGSQASYMGLQGAPSATMTPSATGVAAEGGMFASAAPFLNVAGQVAGIEAIHQGVTEPLSGWAAENLPGGEKEWGTLEKMGTRAAQGATIGTLFGPGPGTAIGGIIGAGVGLIESIFSW